MAKKKLKKKAKQKPFSEKDVFDRIARNALEFLSSSIASVRSDPRRSVIDFSEHLTVVIAYPPAYYCFYC